MRPACFKKQKCISFCSKNSRNEFQKLHTNDPYLVPTYENDCFTSTVYVKTLKPV